MLEAFRIKKHLMSTKRRAISETIGTDLSAKRF